MLALSLNEERRMHDMKRQRTPKMITDDTLLSPRELSPIVGLNVRAIRAAFRNGLKYYSIGTASRPYFKTTMRWWRMYLDEHEQSALIARRAEEILASKPKRIRPPA